MLSIDHRWITFPHCVWEPFVAVRADGSVVTRGDPDFGGEVGVVSPSDVDAIYSANYEFATVQYCHARYNVGDHSFADAGASGLAIYDKCSADNKQGSTRATFKRPLRHGAYTDA